MVATCPLDLKQITTALARSPSLDNKLGEVMSCLVQHHGLQAVGLAHHPTGRLQAYPPKVLPQPELQPNVPNWMFIKQPCYLPDISAQIEQQPAWQVTQGCYWATPCTAGDLFLHIYGEQPVDTAAAALVQDDLQACAELIGYLIATFRSQQQNQQQVAALQAWRQISLAPGKTHDVAEVLSVVTKTALMFSSADLAYLFRLDGDIDRSVYDASRAATNGQTAPSLITCPADIIEAIKQQHAPIYLVDASNQPIFKQPALASYPIKSAAIFPIQWQTDLFGVLMLVFFEHYELTAFERQVIISFCDQATISIENALFTAELSKRVQELETIANIAQATTASQLELPVILHQLVEKVRNLLHTDSASLHLYHPKQNLLIPAASAGIGQIELTQAHFAPGQGVAGLVLSTGQAYYLPDTAQSNHYLDLGRPTRSLLVVPIRVRERILGTLSIDKTAPYQFDASTQRMLEIIAAQAGSAIENGQLYADLNERYQQLAELDKLKNEIVQNVSHELRTPLTFIRSYVELMLDGSLGALNENQLHSLQIVSAKTLFLSKLVEDIITLQKIEGGTLELSLFDLAELTQLTVWVVRPVAEDRRIQVSLHTPDKTLPQVWADRHRITQVLDNLIGNALKFSLDGSQVDIWVDIYPDEPQYLWLRVQDKGIGIPKSDLERIFERFYQGQIASSRRYGGIGVGLAIVKHIIHAHQGRIWVQSEIGQGSCFHVLLPIRQQELN